MLKDLFDKGKCALGFHVEAWRYAREGACQQTQNRQPHLHFAPIEKVRTHHYDAVGGREALAALLDRFLAGAD